MSRTESPMTTRAVELVAAGKLINEVAELLGIHRVTVIRACKRAGVKPKRGRPPKAQLKPAGQR